MGITCKYLNVKLRNKYFIINLDLIAKCLFQGSEVE